jgi:toxin secretion/phage lysis holin
MDKFKMFTNAVSAAFAVVGTAITQFLGGWDIALQTLIVMMAIDYLTGVLCALVWKKSPKSEDGAFESKASLKGLFRKMGMLLAVLIAYQLDSLAGTAGIVRTAVIMFFIANDGFSIIENLGIMGVGLPDALKNAFEVLRSKSDTKTDDSKIE